jgi:hypothetical protein
MKREFLTLLTIGSFAFFASCGNQGTEKKTEEKDKKVEETAKKEECTYAFDLENTSVKWTAYKTTEKIGVSGTFDSLIVSNTQKANSVAGVFENATFEIPVATVNSNAPDRDKKILEHFFGVMDETTSIKGKVLGVDEAIGIISMDITMNNISKAFDFSYEIKDNTLSVSAEGMKLSHWKAQPAVDSLNTVCYDLHKGSDGVSKLWPEVKIEIASKVQKDCK